MQLHKVLIKEIMTTDPVYIGVEEPFSRVWDKLSTNKIRHLPVVDPQRTVVGMVTQRELYRVISPRKTLEGDFVYSKEELDSFILRHVMKKDVIMLKPDDTLGEAISVMVNTKFGGIPIVDEEKRLVGIITQIDVLKAIAQYFI